MKRILVVKTSSMGDVVHACPAITDAAHHVPGLQIDWLVESPFAVIPQMQRHVDQVIPLSWRRWRRSLWRSSTRQAITQLKQQLRDAHYDLVIDLQGLVKSAWWASRTGSTVAGYDKESLREPLARFWYDRTASVSRSWQAVDRCRHLMAAHLHYELPSTPPDFGLSPDLTLSFGSFQPQHHAYAVLIPCASRVEKRWAESHWRAVIASLQAKGLQLLILWGSQEEEALAQQLAQGTSAIVPPFLSIAQAASLLAQAQLVVGLDTGFSHLAAALNRPTVGIYCDHEPGLAGLTGQGPVFSLGGKGRPPSLEQVEQCIAQCLNGTVNLT